MKKQKYIICFLLISLIISLTIIPSFSYSNQTDVKLSESEKEYIKNNPSVSISIDTSWTPYGFLNNNKCAGIIVNIMDIISSRTGLNIDYVAQESYIKAIKACANGQTDLLSGMANDIQVANNNNINITDPYINISYSAVTKNKITDLYNQGASYRIAICNGTYAKIAMEEKMPNYNFIIYKSNQECLDAILNNECDMALVANYSVEYYKDFHEYNNLQAISINDFNWGLCFGINKDCDPILISILNKGIASISETDLNQAIYIGASDATLSSQRFIDYFYDSPILVAILGGIITSIIGLVIFLIITQRKKGYALANEQARKQLQESKDILNAAISSAKMTVWTYDIKTKKIVYNNENSTLKNIENAPESIIENNCIHPDFIDKFKEMFNSLLTSSNPLYYDFMIKSNNGYQWKRIILTPIYENNILTKAIGTTTNITHQKERENNYQKQLDKMSDALEDGIIAKGRYNLTRNTLLYYKKISQDGLKLENDVTYDYALQQMLKTTALSIDCEKIAKMLNRKTLIEDFYKQKLTGYLSYKRIQDNGPAFWSSLHYQLLEEPNSNDIIIFVYTYDITERVREEKMLSKLGASEYDVLGLIDVKTHIFESKSIKGIKTFNNNKNQYIKGLFENVVHQQIIHTVNIEEQLELEKKQSINYVIKQLETMDVYVIQFTAKRFDNSYRRKQLSYTYLDESKTTIFYYCSDITDTYQREQSQLHQTQIALETAKEASKAKTEFFSRMSHDMRTPMNGILGLAHLSKDETDVNILKNYIDKIEQSGNYLLGLINDTLDFQRIESGKLQLDINSIKSSDILQSIIDMVKPTTQKKNITLTVNNINTNLNYYILTDEIRLKQIFINLISNAVKFTNEGGNILLELEQLSYNDGISHNRFKVSDNGVGMSKDFLDNKIFKAFCQEHNIFSSKYAGTGLGLSIVKKLIDLMNGSIEVESTLNKGTTFTIYLDFKIKKANQIAIEKNINNLKENEINSILANTHILLAEDHPLNAEIAKKLLEKKGCIVTIATNGKECIETFKNNPDNYDIILMDIRMPIIDGLQATSAIRQLKIKKATTIPIIAMTANAYDEDIKKSLASGMNAHLSKPIEPKKLYNTLVEYIKKK